MKALAGLPQAPQRKHDKIAEAQFPPRRVFAYSGGLLSGATQVNCGAKTLVRVNLDEPTLAGQRGRRNFVLNVDALKLNSTTCSK